MNGEEIKDIKIILVGMSGTGKTNMIYALTDQKFTADSLTTTSSTFVEKFETINNKKYRLEIWDTAGQEKFRSLTKLFVKDAKVVVFVYDITSMESFQDLLGSFTLQYMNKDFDIPYDVALQYYKEIKDLNNQLYDAFIHDDNYSEEEDLSAYGIEYGYYN